MNTVTERKTKSGATIDDRRVLKMAPPMGYVVFRDKFMSGWGKAPGISYYALAFNDEREQGILERNGAARSDMTSPRNDARIILQFDIEGRPLMSLQDGDHLSVQDKRSAPAWYTEGAFS